MKFNELIKDLRLGKRLTLRDFCAELKIDPSNWSKVERGVNPPPNDIGFLKKLSGFFKLNADQERELTDAAALDRWELPPDIAANETLMKSAMPAFFRIARDKNFSPEDVAAFVEGVKKIHTPDHV